MVVGRLRMRQWETQEGEKRSVIEVEADEVGPSLKWATAKVEKTSRGGGGGAGGGGDEWGSSDGPGVPVADEVPF
jgi:single-strand DNA-binding protein